MEDISILHELGVRVWVNAIPGKDSLRRVTDDEDGARACLLDALDNVHLHLLQVLELVAQDAVQLGQVDLHEVYDEHHICVVNDW